MTFGIRPMDLGDGALPPECCPARDANARDANECVRAETPRNVVKLSALFRSGASRSGEVRPKCTTVDCVSGSRWSRRCNRSCC